MECTVSTELSFASRSSPHVATLISGVDVNGLSGRLSLTLINSAVHLFTVALVNKSFPSAELIFSLMALVLEVLDHGTFLKFIHFLKDTDPCLFYWLVTTKQYAQLLFFLYTSLLPNSWPSLAQNLSINHHKFSLQHIADYLKQSEFQWSNNFSHCSLQCHKPTCL